MRRRDFIAALGGAAVTPVSVASAPQVTMPVIGFVHPASAAAYTNMIVAFRGGLAEAGFTEGQNVAIEFRWGENHYDRVTALERELLGYKTALLVIAGPSPEMLHAAGAVPVVFVTGADPVTSGLVAKLNRPDGNATGVSIFTGPLAGKQIGIIRALLPQAHAIAVVADGLTDASYTKDIITASGLQPLLFTVSGPEDLDGAFAAAAAQHADAVLLFSSPLMTSQRDRLVSVTLRHNLPVVFPLREYAVAGGLMSYGASIASAYRQAGIYAGRILKGEKPADLPVMLPTKFEFVINLKTAKALGLTFPPTLLALADEVIE